MKTALFVFPASFHPQDDVNIVREALRDACEAEDLGAEAVFLAEHHFDGTAAYADPTTFAMAVACHTQRVQIGFAVLQASLYHPLRLAEQLSLLDIVSNGRMIVGMGKGSAANTHEYNAFQIPPAEARDRFNELEEVIRRLFTEQKVVHRGKYWEFECPMLRPRPLTSGGPLICRAVTSDEAARRQALRGEPMLLFSARPNPELKRRVDLYTQTMSDAGFDDDQVRRALAASWLWKQTIIDETDKGAIGTGLGYLEQADAYRSLLSDTYRSRQEGRRLGEIPPGTFCGSPATVLEQIGDLPTFGIGGLLLKFAHGPTPHDYAMRGFRLFMEEVRPKLGRHEAAPIVGSRPTAETAAGL